MGDWKPRAKYDHVFAILRVDLFHGTDAPPDRNITINGRRRVIGIQPRPQSPRAA